MKVQGLLFIFATPQRWFADAILTHSKYHETHALASGSASGVANGGIRRATAAARATSATFNTQPTNLSMFDNASRSVRKVKKEPGEGLVDIPAVPDLLCGLKSTFTVTIVYFLVYALLAGVRFTNQYVESGSGKSFERVFENAGTFCVYIAPMLCVLFFEAFKPYLDMTGEFPADWLQWSIVICSAAFCIQTFAYLVAEWYSNRLQGLVRPSEQQRIVPMVQMWRSIFNVFTWALYVSLAIVAYGTLSLRFPDRNTPPPIFCSWLLATTYTLVYIALFLVRRLHSGQDPSFLLEILKTASTSISFAPMLCILFLGTQMLLRWHQHPPLDTVVENWMLISTYAVVLQVVIVVAAPYCAGAELRASGPSGAVDFVSDNTWVFTCVSFVRCILMGLLYYGVLYGVTRTLWETSGAAPLFHTLYLLACIYFAAYSVMWLVTFTDKVSADAIIFLKMCKDTIAFCPMLSVLFLATFARAHQIRLQNMEYGEPQSYCQDAMILALLSIWTQVLMVCGAIWTTQESRIHLLFHIGFEAAMVTVYASVLVVALSTLTINAKNANADGMWLRFV